MTSDKAGAEAAPQRSIDGTTDKEVAGAFTGAPPLAPAKSPDQKELEEVFPPAK